MLVAAAELKMHGIAHTSVPVPSPLKPEALENSDDRRVHVSGASLRVAFGIEIDSDSPGVS